MSRESGVADGSLGESRVRESRSVRDSRTLARRSALIWLNGPSEVLSITRDDEGEDDELANASSILSARNFNPAPSTILRTSSVRSISCNRLRELPNLAI